MAQLEEILANEASNWPHSLPAQVHVRRSDADNGAHFGNFFAVSRSSDIGANLADGQVDAECRAPLP